jgi:osmoprotectant transport system permease protein
LNIKRLVAFASMLFVLLEGGATTAATNAPLNVGSKRFTESYVLAEVIRQTAERAGETGAVHKQGLGNTAIVLGALKSGSIDIYPEYTGTIAREILKLDRVPPLVQLNEKLAPLGLAVSTPLGFNNTYALALPSKLARERNITKLSDLKAHPKLRLGLSQEFIGRADGWPGLKATYGLPWTNLKGLDHGLAYEAIAQGQVDVIDIYSTDAKLGKYQLTVLVDDAAYFPRYDAVLLHTRDLPTRLPKTWSAISTLEGRIDDAAMQRMNAAAELEKKSFADVAREFVSGATANALVPKASGEAKPAGSSSPSFWGKLFGADFLRLAGEHLALVFASLAASVLIGVPLGMVAARQPRLGGAILGITGVLQTIPSLALLAILIPLTGSIGLVPAFIALSIYALLPIVRNTYTGLTQVPVGTKQAGFSLGMSPPLVMRLIELPLALPTILAGIKTSAVINVGTATIAAFIGAGGFGERIVTGLALNDNTTLLAGALPVAALALIVEWSFTVVERRLLVPLNQHSASR